MEVVQSCNFSGVLIFIEWVGVVVCVGGVDERQNLEVQFHFVLERESLSHCKRESCVFVHVKTLRKVPGVMR